MTRELGQSQEEQRGLELEKWGSQPSLAPCWSWLRGGGDATGEEEALDQKGCSQPALTEWLPWSSRVWEAVVRVDGWAGFPLPAQWARPASLMCWPDGGWRREVWRLLLSRALCAAVPAPDNP